MIVLDTPTIVEIIILTTILELLIITGHCYFGSAKSFYKKHLLKYRIHHGYVGLILFVISLIFANSSLFILGTSLVLSDCIHHFIVLPVWIGRTDFP